MCSHTDKHARAQAPGHALPLEMREWDQRPTDTVHVGTHTHTQVCTHAHVPKNVQTARGTQAWAHTPRLAGTPTPQEYTNRIRHTDICTCKHTGKHPSPETPQKGPNTHTRGRAVHRGDRRPLSCSGESEPQSPHPCTPALTSDLRGPCRLPHRDPRTEKPPPRSCLPATHLVWVLLISRAP